MDSIKVSVLSVNISLEKGTVKQATDAIVLTERGVDGDAHSGLWHRQLSLLGKESFDRFEQMAGRKLAFGEFAENITTQGLELVDCKPFDRFSGTTVELEVTQIGKECHGSGCAIYREVGKCVMPKEGIFARVLKGGKLQSGDVLEYVPKVFRIEVITLSDRAFSGEYSDRSGPAIVEKMQEWADQHGLKSEIQLTLIPDSPEQLESILASFSESADIIITTGGTGIGPRDFTPDVVKAMLDKEIPGIMEHIRTKYGAAKPNALISRSVCGTMNSSLIFALPGSQKAINEYLEEIRPLLWHLLLMQHGIDSH